MLDFPLTYKTIYYICQSECACSHQKAQSCHWNEKSEYIRDICND